MFIIGFQLTVLGWYVNTRDNFQILNNMIKADLDDPQEHFFSGFKPTPSYFLIAFLICGPLVMIGSCFGCFSIASHNKFLKCPYFFLTIVSALGFILVALVNESFSTTLDGIVERQASTYCHPHNYGIFKEQLNCTEKVQEFTLECGEECKERVTLLKSMRGCDTLTNMCKDYTYESLGRGLCTVGGKYPKTWIGQAADGAAEWSPLECQKICNEHPECSGASFAVAHNPDMHPFRVGDTCYVVSTIQPTTPALAWIEMVSANQSTSRAIIDSSSGAKGFECFKKGDPKFLTFGIFFAGLVEEAMWISAIAICLVMCHSCTLLFTMATKRKGKKGSTSICARMLCPCCIPKATRRLAVDPDEADEYEYGSSDEEEYPDDDL